MNNMNLSILILAATDIKQCEDQQKDWLFVYYIKTGFSLLYKDWLFPII